jgi:hypothetical protein
MAPTFNFLINRLHGFPGPNQVMSLDGSIDDPFDFGAEPAMTFIRTAQIRDETCRLRGCRVSRNQSSYGAGRHTESLRGGCNARRDRSVTVQGIADGGFALLSSGPDHLIDVAEGLEALIKLQCRERGNAPEFGHGDLTNVGPDGLLDPCASASQAFESADASVPQHQFAGSQFQAKGRIGWRCGRGPSPWIWTENADKVRFWTETADMFGAPFALTGSFKNALNCQTYIKRSGAYAHSRNLHRLSARVTDWSRIDDVDIGAGHHGHASAARWSSLRGCRVHRRSRWRPHRP